MDIKQQAIHELSQERHRAAVDALKAEMALASMKKSLWQRFLDILPFTITWKSK